MKDFDLFGSQILFRFGGSPTHNTKFGSLFTLGILAVIALRLFFIVKEVFERKSPTMIFQERQVADPKIFTINPRTFQFAFGLQAPDYEHYINDRIYKFTMTRQHRTSYLDENGLAQQKWNVTLIDLVPCSLRNFQSDATLSYFQNIAYQKMMCLPPGEDFYTEGDFTSPDFRQLVLTLTACKGTDCEDQTVIDSYLKSAYFAIYFSDVYVDPTSKSEPFVHYARDMFWTTSSTFPKEVKWHLRNNYIESDFGWVYESVSTDSFPMYSQTEVNILPSDATTDFFKFTLKMEKQKENIYQRKYKNINNIISEIGGFTQSLLAIGFLICSRLSQLDLNKEIINEAFNFENMEPTVYSNSNSKKDPKNAMKAIETSAVNNQNGILNNQINHSHSASFRQSRLHSPNPPQVAVIQSTDNNNNNHEETRDVIQQRSKGSGGSGGSGGGGGNAITNNNNNNTPKLNTQIQLEQLKSEQVTSFQNEFKSGHALKPNFLPSPTNQTSNQYDALLQNSFVSSSQIAPNLQQSQQQSFFHSALNNNTGGLRLNQKRTRRLSSSVQYEYPAADGIAVSPADDYEKNCADDQRSKQLDESHQSENERKFLQFLIQNPGNGNLGPGIEINHQQPLQMPYSSNLILPQISGQQSSSNTRPVSSDHEKLQLQQQKLEEKLEKQKESDFKRLMQKATSSMTLSVWEYMKFFMWPFGEVKKKKQIIDYSIDKLYYHLDVLYVVKKLLEVDKLKRILLDQNQLKLFEYIPKPTIKTNYAEAKLSENGTDLKMEIDKYYQDTRTELQKAQEAYIAYRQIANKPSLNQVDSNILGLLDSKLINLFGVDPSLTAAAREQSNSQLIVKQHNGSFAIGNQQTQLDSSNMQLQQPFQSINHLPIMQFNQIQLSQQQQLYQQQQYQLQQFQLAQLQQQQQQQQQLLFLQQQQQQQQLFTPLAVEQQISQSQFRPALKTIMNNAFEKNEGPSVSTAAPVTAMGSQKKLKSRDSPPEGSRFATSTNGAGGKDLFKLKSKVQTEEHLNPDDAIVVVVDEEAESNQNQLIISQNVNSAMMCENILNSPHNVDSNRSMFSEIASDEEKNKSYPLEFGMSDAHHAINDR